MPLILEYEGKELFKKYGLNLSKSILVTSAEEAKEAATKLGLPVVVKAQVLSGGRGKRGLIKLAKTEEEVIQHSIDILSKTDIKTNNKPVTHLLIEEGAEIAEEYFISMVNDSHTLETLVLFSTEGGVDIESLAEERPEAIDRIRVPYDGDYQPFMFMSTLAKRGLTGNIKIGVAKIISTLVDMMKKEDLTLAEINPLVITKSGEVLVLDARIMIDANANFRHPERENYLSEELRNTENEADAKAHDLAYVDLGGEIGMLSVGAGLGMATADLIAIFGGSPRNFLDVGGGAGQEKVEHALRIMVKDEGLKSVLINAFGGITRMDEVARGIVAARNNLEAFSGDNAIPIIVRLMGTNYEEGIKIVEEAGMKAYKDMNPAIEAAVAAAKGGN
ncbi:MAG: ADP-forming succinate--CoA ligase subunit beta [Candidatus Heimdallarchaeota archaeon]|nr:ADP-forming succinate--CoA ligase subunit beta [Candidatus Heimdallarchaeota archaeon]